MNRFFYLKKIRFRSLDISDVIIDIAAYETSHLWLFRLNSRQYQITVDGMELKLSFHEIKKSINFFILEKKNVKNIFYFKKASETIFSEIIFLAEVTLKGTSTDILKTVFRKVLFMGSSMPVFNFKGYTVTE